MVTVSVLTVTCRYGGIDVAVESLRRQGAPFEWVLVDALHSERAGPVAEVCRGLALKHLPDPPKVEDAYWNLCRATNEGLRHCEGDVVVFYQDYIWLPDDGVARFIDLGQRAFVTGVGHQGGGPPVANPVGLVTIFAEPYVGPPRGITRSDRRFRRDGGVQPCHPDDWELAWAAAPRKALEELAGLDGQYDLGRGFENNDLALRAARAGHKLLIDHGNVCVGLPHWRYFDEPIETGAALQRNAALYGRRRAGQG